MQRHLNLEFGDLAKLQRFLDHFESCPICQEGFEQLRQAADLERAFEGYLAQIPEEEPAPVLSEWMIDEMRKDEIDRKRLDSTRDLG